MYRVASLTEATCFTEFSATGSLKTYSTNGKALRISGKIAPNSPEAATYTLLNHARLHRANHESIGVLWMRCPRSSSFRISWKSSYLSTAIYEDLGDLD
jgi:hypothetical protein